MKDSKIIAKRLLMDLGKDELKDGKSVAEDIRVMAEAVSYTHLDFSCPYCIRLRQGES